MRSRADDADVVNLKAHEAVQPRSRMTLATASSTSRVFRGTAATITPRSSRNTGRHSRAALASRLAISP